MSNENTASEFIDVGGNIDDAVAPEVMEAGVYALHIQEASIVKTNGVATSLKVRVDFSEHPEAATMFVNIQLPKPEDDAKKRNTKLLMLKRFMGMFSIPYEGGRFNISDFAGAQAAHAPVQKQSYDKDKDGAPLVDVNGEAVLRWSNGLNLFN
jgi:hypothetical protein